MKRFFCFAMIFAFLLVQVVFTVNADPQTTITVQIGNEIMTVNGNTQEVDPGRGTVPVILEARTLLPIRVMIESLGGVVDWVEAEKRVTIEMDGNVIELSMANPQYKEALVFMGVGKPYETIGFHEGSKSMTVNSETVTNDVPAIIINARTYMPLRFISENVGCEVLWEDATKTVTVLYGGSTEPTTIPQPTTIVPTNVPTTIPTGTVIPTPTPTDTVSPTTEPTDTVIPTTEPTDTVIPTPTPTTSGPVQMEHRAWQLHINDISWIKNMIDNASSLDINTIQLSHDIIMNYADLESTAVQSVVNEAADYASSKGIETYAWVHEFNAIPSSYMTGGKIDFDNPELWTYLEERYDDMFTNKAPSLSGIVLTFHETDYTVYKDEEISSSKPPDERTAILIENILNFCKKHGKKLIVRTFAYEPSEVEDIGAAFEILSQHIGLDPDMTIMSKEVPHDFHLHYPHNPRLGNVSGFNQILETDLGAEFYGQSLVPFDQTEYVKYRLDHGKANGIIGAVARVERNKEGRQGYPCWGTLSEISIYTFSRMLYYDLDVDIDTLRLEWIKARFGDNPGAPHILEAYRKTLDIYKNAYFFNKEWIANHSAIPSFDYANKHIERNSVGEWSGIQADIQRQQDLLSGKESKITEVNNEKDVAVQLCDEALSDLAQAQSHLNASDYNELQEGFQFLKDVVLAYKYQANVLIRYYYYKNSGSGLSDVENAISEMLSHADYLESTYGSNNYLIDGRGTASGNLQEFADDISGML